jgi:hypothetical protein
MGRIGGRSALDYSFMKKSITANAVMGSEITMTPEEKTRWNTMSRHEKFLDHPEWAIIKKLCQAAQWEEAQLRIARLELKYGGGRW